MLKKLSDEQENAVKEEAQNLSIIACAGSGKTTTLTRRIAHHINNEDRDHEKMAVITFTVLAAEDLEFKLFDLINDNSATSNMFIGTIHSFCLNLFKEYNKNKAILNPISESSQFAILQKHRYEWDLDNLPGRYPLSKKIDKIISTIDIIKLNRVSKEKLNKTNPEMARIIRLYSNYLDDNGYLDYADMLIKTLNLIEKDQDFLNWIINKYSYLFVDEYQDVDPVQAKIFDILSKEVEISVVGDDDQAIYQFRGTDEKNLIYFSEKAETQTKYLSENWRCPNNIVKVAKNSIEKIDNRINKRIETSISFGNVIVRQFDSIESETNFIIEEIKKMLRSKEAYSYDNFAILLRSVASYGGHYIKALREADIPYIARSSNNFFELDEIQILVSLMEWLAKDSECINHINLLNPAFENDISGEYLKSKFNNISDITKEDFLDFGASKRDYELLKKFLELRYYYEKRKFTSLLDIVIRIIDILGLMKPEIEENIKYNVAFLTKIIEEFENIQNSKNIKDLCVYITMHAKDHFDEIIPPSKKDDGVNILTIHKAKGLEFEHVFVPMLVEKRFPVQKRNNRWFIDDELFDSTRYKSSLENERRLFYVAVTRAKRSLYLLASEDVGLKNKKSPSQFFNETKNLSFPKNMSPQKPIKKSKNTAEPITVGYSSLEYYLTCPYRYKLLVEYGLSFPKVSYFQFGKMIHDIFARINIALKNGDSFGCRNAIEYLEDIFPIYYQNAKIREYDKRKQKIKASKIIKKYYNDQIKLFNNIVDVEKDFSYINSKAIIKGRFDVMVKDNDNNVVIMDYKTGKKHPDLNPEFQMQFYSLAACEQLGIPASKALINFIEEDQIEEIDINKRFLNRGKTKINMIVDGIVNREFEPTPNSSICKNCEANIFCPYEV